MDIIQENILNLTSLWRYAARPFGGIVEGEGYGIARIPDTEWPNKAWIESSCPYPARVLSEIRAQLETGMTLTVFGQPTAALSAVLEQLDMRLNFQLTAMSMEPWEPAFCLPDSDIRQVKTPEDIYWWCLVFYSAFGYRIAESVVAASLDKVNYYLLEDEGVPVGTLALYQTGGVTGVHSMGVSPKARGRGLATQAMYHSLECARSSGSSLVTLQASEMGRGLYEKLGFSQDFILNNYKLIRTS